MMLLKCINEATDNDNEHWSSKSTCQHIEESNDSSDSDERTIKIGDYVIAHYAGKKFVYYYIAEVMGEVLDDGEKLYALRFFKKEKATSYHILQENDTDVVNEECILVKIAAPNIVTQIDRKDQYLFNTANLHFIVH